MRRTCVLSISCILLLSACDQDALHPDEAARMEAPPIELRVTQPALSAGKKGNRKKGNDGGDERTAAVRAYLAAVNADLAARGLGIAVEKVEWVGGGDSHEAGQTVFANDRQLRLGAQWVPGDPRRNADGNNITYVVDRSFALANGAIDAEPAIDASFDTWNGVTCSKLNVVKLPDDGATNYSTILTTGEPADAFYADISTIGFIPGVFFDIVLGDSASTSVLGVTFTFVFIDENDNPTDINNDGYDDVALKEVWYNDAFVWSTDDSATDVETVALHENGHALGLGHFGKVFVTGNGKLHVAPRAVMNAFVLGTLRDLLGTDNGAYCGLYAAWPQ